jgi:hypothetical protein
VVRRVTIDLDDEMFQPALMPQGLNEGDREYDYDYGFVEGFNHFLSLVESRQP